MRCKNFQGIFLIKETILAQVQSIGKVKVIDRLNKYGLQMDINKSNRVKTKIIVHLHQ